ncbi:hypothetical protein [Maridesulfovibrio salexigens]|uniref:Uncharacterized protein n=1 Tax=Maridesulfovibrio salexigens (strain ATCC 14822 / DSM 2638 / NCIMB 8403 / VKM B-1763) TaxID=526222 RepID=C6C1L6_MARSD|nr:hypothetical protein [Maridesulfovibrio salexigens]ACS81191.1 hypothetical protein Desal_3140 [Maridesulfovibrio salexigens DSM 2638]
MKKLNSLIFAVVLFLAGFFAGTVFDSNNESKAGGLVSNQYFSVYELKGPKGYRTCFGVSFKNGVSKKDVIIDWKSNSNFVGYIKE